MFQARRQQNNGACEEQTRVRKVLQTMNESVAFIVRGIVRHDRRQAGNLGMHVVVRRRLDEPTHRRVGLRTVAHT